jgi:hypothetical protein
MMLLGEAPEFTASTAEVQKSLAMVVTEGLISAHPIHTDRAAGCSYALLETG